LKIWFLDLTLTSGSFSSWWTILTLTSLDHRGIRTRTHTYTHIQTPVAVLVLGMERLVTPPRLNPRRLLPLGFILVILFCLVQIVLRPAGGWFSSDSSSTGCDHDDLYPKIVLFGDSLTAWMLRPETNVFHSSLVSLCDRRCDVVIRGKWCRIIMLWLTGHLKWILFCSCLFKDSLDSTARPPSSLPRHCSPGAPASRFTS